MMGDQDRTNVHFFLTFLCSGLRCKTLARSAAMWLFGQGVLLFDEDAVIDILVVKASAFELDHKGCDARYQTEYGRRVNRPEAPVNWPEEP
jgi:hypothetical protein